MCKRYFKPVVITAVLCVTAALLVVSCSDKDSPTNPGTPAEISLRTNDLRYEVGDTIYATAINTTNDTVPVFNCAGRPMVMCQRLVDGGWDWDATMYDPVCRNPLLDYYLLPKQSVSCYQPLLCHKPGTFRLVLYLGEAGRPTGVSPERVYSDPILVE